MDGRPKLTTQLRRVSRAMLCSRRLILASWTCGWTGLTTVVVAGIRKSCCASHRRVKAMRYRYMARQPGTLWLAESSRQPSAY